MHQTIDQMREILEPDADEYTVSKEMLQAWLEEVERLRREENNAKRSQEKSSVRREPEILSIDEAWSNFATTERRMRSRR